MRRRVRKFLREKGFESEEHHDVVVVFEARTLIIRGKHSKPTKSSAINTRH